MSYPVNIPVVYTALAVTSGLPLDTFTYSWLFSDTATGAGNTLNKTWSTTGVKTATVTATDNQTGGTASATKIITVGDWATITWSSTTKTVKPGASLGMFDNGLPFIVSGNLMVNIFDFSTPSSVCSYNSATGIATENATCTSSLAGTGTLGNGAAGGILLTTGPNSGKILVLPRGNALTNYGFVDPQTLVMTLSGHTAANITFNSGAIKCIFLPTDSTNIIILGSDGVSAATLQNYNQSTDTFTSLSAVGGPSFNNVADAFYFNSKIWVIEYGTTATKVYSIVTNTWSSGPALLGTAFSKNATVKLASRLGLPFLVSYENPGRACWWDGVSAGLTTGANFPLASLNGGVLTNASDSVWETSTDGFIMSMGGYGSSDTVLYSNSVFYNPYLDTFTVGPGLFSGGYARRSAFALGKFWCCNDSGTIYTTQAW
jgi:hypothetical protein